MRKNTWHDIGEFAYIYGSDKKGNFVLGKIAAGSYDVEVFFSSFPHVVTWICHFQKYGKVSHNTMMRFYVQIFI